MTIFAVVCAGMFPLIHVGRPWLGYWLFPLPFTMTVWPQFRSPLLWDVFAVSTYATISVVFWYVGMIPDFGTFRDRAVELRDLGRPAVHQVLEHRREMRSGRRRIELRLHHPQ